MVKFLSKSLLLGLSLCSNKAKAFGLLAMCLGFLALSACTKREDLQKQGSEYDNAWGPTHVYKTLSLSLTNEQGANLLEQKENQYRLSLFGELSKTYLPSKYMAESKQLSIEIDAPDSRQKEDNLHSSFVVSYKGAKLRGVAYFYTPPRPKELEGAYINGSMLIKEVKIDGISILPSEEDGDLTLPLLHTEGKLSVVR